jgi:hypothetical protein
MYHLDFRLIMSQIFKMNTCLEVRMNANEVGFLGSLHYNQRLSKASLLPLIRNHIPTTYKMIPIK